MDYTDVEIKNIKQRAYDKGKREGVLITLVIFIVALILMINYDDIIGLIKK